MKKCSLFLLFSLLFATAFSQTDSIVLVEDAIQGFVKKNLGENVNSEYGELLPVISADGKTLFLCRHGHPDNIGGTNEDIWFSTRNADGSWGKIQNLGKPVNNDYNNSVFGITPDNNTLFVMGLYNEDGTNRGNGVSVSRKTKTGWSIPEALNVKDYYNYNSFVNYCLSPDRKTLLMAVNRDDSHGGSDLYACFWEGENNWSSPVNLGQTLNTDGQEASPFLAADARTLYFASNGLPGYGSFDIFVTKRLDDTWKNWSQPKNLGPEINSAGMEAFYTVPASGEHAYLVSEDQAIGSSDIFQIQLAESARPDPVVIVYGKVFNQKTKQPLESEITYYKGEKNKAEGYARSNTSDGSYQLVLPLGTAYSITARKTGFSKDTKEVDLTKTDKDTTRIERNFYLLPAPGSVAEKSGQVNEQYNSSNTLKEVLYFDYNQSNTRNKSQPNLEELFKSLQAEASIKIELHGHTDSKGNEAYNQTLSRKRAEYVKNYLTSRGIDASRISIKFHGESQPITKNTTPEGRAKNRRVEVKKIQ